MFCFYLQLVFNCVVNITKQGVKTAIKEINLDHQLAMYDPWGRMLVVS